MITLDGPISDTQVTTLLNQKDDQEKVGAAVATSLSKTEDDLMALYSVGDNSKINTGSSAMNQRAEALIKQYGSLQGAQEALRIKYQRALRAYESFRELIKNAHDILMEGIRMLKVN